MSEFYRIAPTENYLSHSAKGTKWKNHKYVEIKNGRYIYKDDERRRRQKISTEYKSRSAKSQEEADMYARQMKILDDEQKIAELSRPLGARFQEAFYNTFVDLYNYAKSKGLLDNYLEKERLEQEKEYLENLQKARDFIKTQEIQKAESVKKGEQILKDMERKKQKNKEVKDETTEKEKAREKRKTNFRNRITIKR